MPGQPGRLLEDVERTANSRESRPSRWTCGILISGVYVWSTTTPASAWRSTWIRRCRASAERGRPQAVLSGNRPPFRSRAMEAWSVDQKVRHEFIEPGKPGQNVFVESFNGRLREECLNTQWFLQLERRQGQDRSVEKRLQQRSAAQLVGLPDADRIREKRDEGGGMRPAIALNRGSTRPACRELSEKPQEVSKTCPKGVIRVSPSCPKTDLAMHLPRRLGSYSHLLPSLPRWIDADSHRWGSSARRPQPSIAPGSSHLAPRMRISEEQKSTSSSRLAQEQQSARRSLESTSLWAKTRKGRPCQQHRMPRQISSASFLLAKASALSVSLRTGVNAQSRGLGSVRFSHTIVRDQTTWVSWR